MLGGKCTNGKISRINRQRVMGSDILDSVTKEGLSNMVICGQKPE